MLYETNLEAKSPLEDDLNNSFEEGDLEVIYEWVDNVPLSRPKKNLVRDFADGHMIAQIIRHHLPTPYKGYIQVHNYVATSNTKTKYNNWNQLNQKVFSKFHKKF